MKNPIVEDITIAAIKSAPPITATIAIRHGIDWYGLVSIATVVYTVVLTATTIIRHWNMWMHFFSRVKKICKQWKNCLLGNLYDKE